MAWYLAPVSFSAWPESVGLGLVQEAVVPVAVVPVVVGLILGLGLVLCLAEVGPAAGLRLVLGLVLLGLGLLVAHPGLGHLSCPLSGMVPWCKGPII